MYACTIGADIERTLPVWQPRPVRREPEPEPEPPPAATQAQGPGQRRSGETLGADDKPDPLAELAKEVLGK